MRVGVLALQGDFREHLAVVSRLGADGVEVRTPEALDHIDAIIVPGGESTTIGRLATIYGLIEPLRSHIGAGMPTLGTCAGLIFLASSTTGAPQAQLDVLDVVVERNAFGRQIDSHEADLSVAGFSEPIHAVFIRAPWIEKVGADVEVLASVTGTDGRTHPVFVKQDRILATSFHPELTSDDRVHSRLLDLVDDR